MSRSCTSAALPVDQSPEQVPAPWLADLAGRPYVLALGTVERRKNLPALAAAFGAAAAGDAALVIAGAPGDDSAALDAAIDAAAGRRPGASDPARPDRR